MIKVVFFDVGGVILDEISLYEKLFEVQKKALRQCGVAVSDEEFERAIADAIHSFAPGLQRAIVWCLTKPDKECCDKATRTARAIFEDWLDNQPRRLVPGIATAIDTLSQSFTLALTAPPEERVRAILEQQDLLHYFDLTGLSADTKLIKPDPRIYVHLARACRIQPQESILISNRLDTDLIPARSAGMRTLRFKSGPYAVQEPRTPEEIPHKTVTAAEELPSAVEAIAERYRNR